MATDNVRLSKPTKPKPRFSKDEVIGGLLILDYLGFYPGPRGYRSKHRYMVECKHCGKERVVQQQTLVLHLNKKIGDGCGCARSNKGGPPKGLSKRA